MHDKGGSSCLPPTAVGRTWLPRFLQPRLGAGGHPRWRAAGQPVCSFFLQSGLEFGAGGEDQSVVIRSWRPHRLLALPPTLRLTPGEMRK